MDGASEGIRTGKLERKMGMRASQTAEMHFENVRVPKENLLGELGKGFDLAMGTLDGGRIGVGAQALGIAEGAFERMVDYMMEREQFGITLSRLDTLRFSVARLRMQLESARLLVYRAADNKDKGLPYKAEAAMAKLAASEAAVDLTRKSIPVSRRIRIYGRASDRENVPRCQDHGNLRGYVGGTADGHSCRYLRSEKINGFRVRTRGGRVRTRRQQDPLEISF